MNFKSTRSGNQEVDMAFKTFYASILNIKAKTTMKKKMKNLTWTFVANMVHILKSWTVIRMKNRTLLSNWMRSMRKQEAWKKKKLKKNFKKSQTKKTCFSTFEYLKKNILLSEYIVLDKATQTSIFMPLRFYVKSIFLRISYVCT